MFEFWFWLLFWSWMISGLLISTIFFGYFALNRTFKSEQEYPGDPYEALASLVEASFIGFLWPLHAFAYIVHFLYSTVGRLASQ